MARSRCPLAGLVLGREEAYRFDPRKLESSEADARSASSGAGMQLRDEPNFVVAGVTDGTNVGGHGSDTTLRTSEALTKETVRLKADASRQSSTGTPALRSPDQPGESEVRLRASLVRQPGSFEANHQLGDFYFRSQKYREAIPLLDAAYHANPNDYANAHDLALAYQAQGDFVRAWAQVQKMLTTVQKPELHHLLGDLDERLDDPLGAVREYEQAARLLPSEQNYFDWATELLLHRATRAAEEVFAKGTNVHPNSGRMLAGLGAALYADGSYDEAARRLCAASDLNPAEDAPYLLAMYVVFESPLQMLADSPSNYLREPEVMEFLAPVPTEWDETKVLEARIADYVVVARRNGRDWYVGAMTDWTPRQLEIDLSFLPQGSFTMDAYQDGVNADRFGSDYKKTSGQVNKGNKLKIQLAPGGGWAARIHP